MQFRYSMELEEVDKYLTQIKDVVLDTSFRSIVPTKELVASEAQLFDNLTVYISPRLC